MMNEEDAIRGSKHFRLRSEVGIANHNGMCPGIMICARDDLLNSIIADLGTVTLALNANSLAIHCCDYVDTLITCWRGQT